MTHSLFIAGLSLNIYLFIHRLYFIYERIRVTACLRHGSDIQYFVTSTLKLNETDLEMMIDWGFHLPSHCYCHLRTMMLTVARSDEEP